MAKRESFMLTLTLALAVFVVGCATYTTQGEKFYPGNPKGMAYIHVMDDSLKIGMTMSQVKEALHCDPLIVKARGNAIFWQYSFSETSEKPSWLKILLVDTTTEGKKAVLTLVFDRGSKTLVGQEPYFETIRGFVQEPNVTLIKYAVLGAGIGYAAVSIGNEVSRSIKDAASGAASSH